MRSLAEWRKLMVVCAAAVAFSYVAWLAMFFASHQWLLDANGHPFATDFLAPLAAGELARTGHAISAYNGNLQHAAEVTIAGHDFAGLLGWPYPPHYFFVLVPLSYLSFAYAFLLWVLVTMSGYAVTIAAIAQRREAALFAIAAPWCLADMMVGQNGFFTAALIGLALLSLERRPVVSAIMITLMTYKPQFGLLLPIALVAGGHWRVIGTVSIMLLGLAAITGAVFGFDTFGAFLNALPSTTHSLVEQGGVGWAKLQSVYGFARWIGVPSAMAWTAQAVFAVIVAAVIAWLWRSRATPALKAAGLSAAVVLATPYVFLYDMPVLAVAMAFLARDEAFDRVEIGVVALATLAFIVAALLVAPLAWIGALVLLAACGRRWLQGTILRETPAATIRGAS